MESEKRAMQIYSNISMFLKFRGYNNRDEGQKNESEPWRTHMYVIEEY